MKFDFDCTFLSQETVTSAKGNKYIKVLLMQGTDTLTCMSEVSIPLKQGEKFIANLEYNPRFKSIKVVGVKA